MPLPSPSSFYSLCHSWSQVRKEIRSAAAVSPVSRVPSMSWGSPSTHHQARIPGSLATKALAQDSAPDGQGPVSGRTAAPGPLGIQGAYPWAEKPASCPLFQTPPATSFCSASIPVAHIPHSRGSARSPTLPPKFTISPQSGIPPPLQPNLLFPPKALLCTLTLPHLGATASSRLPALTRFSALHSQWDPER